MINDLNTASNDLWKYVNDTTLMELIPSGGSSNVQFAVNDIQNQSNALINEDKCKEMRIQFNKCNTNQKLHPVTINGKQAELVLKGKF